MSELDLLKSLEALNTLKALIESELEKVGAWRDHLQVYPIRRGQVE